MANPTAVIITVSHVDAVPLPEPFPEQPGFDPEYNRRRMHHNPVPSWSAAQKYRFEIDISTHCLLDPQAAFPSLFALANWFYHHTFGRDFCVVLGSEELAVAAAIQPFNLRYLYCPKKYNTSALPEKLLREMRFLNHPSLNRCTPSPFFVCFFFFFLVSKIPSVRPYRYL